MLKMMNSRVVVRRTMLCGKECWSVKNSHVWKMRVELMRMLIWMCEHTRRDEIRNQDIRAKVGVAPWRIRYEK
ncbi:hypothetical protein H5410_049626 [Solanum commersonii]|uniref:Uncharacterized protein n=1 Tax=Solanum commersonii TaxID=4109 RepID=A0A9J5WUM1_SOLCO|nr:hypothetical protein H5410_049626 [Solanum commersonii]